MISIAPMARSWERERERERGREGERGSIRWCHGTSMWENLGDLEDDDILFESRHFSLQIIQGFTFRLGHALRQVNRHSKHPTQAQKIQSVDFTQHWSLDIICLQELSLSLLISAVQLLHLGLDALQWDHNRTRRPFHRSDIVEGLEVFHQRCDHLLLLSHLSSLQTLSQLQVFRTLLFVRLVFVSIDHRLLQIVQCQGKVVSLPRSQQSVTLMDQSVLATHLRQWISWLGLAKARCWEGGEEGNKESPDHPETWVNKTGERFSDGRGQASVSACWANCINLRGGGNFLILLIDDDSELFLDHTQVLRSRWSSVDHFISFLSGLCLDLLFHHSCCGAIFTTIVFTDWVEDERDRPFFVTPESGGRELHGKTWRERIRSSSPKSDTGHEAKKDNHHATAKDPSLLPLDVVLDFLLDLRNEKGVNLITIQPNSEREREMRRGREGAAIAYSI
jgi:hypothetical protein